MKRTILFVDDERSLLDLYEDIFSPEYTVLTAASGEEALEKFGEHVDFAFFDRKMPGMSGDDAIQTLRDQGHNTPMCIASAVSSDVEPNVEYEVYLEKPLDMDEMRSIVREYLS